MADYELLKAALAAGHSYDDIRNYHLDQGLEVPPRPPISKVFAGEHTVKGSVYGGPSIEDLSKPGRDAINEGAGPIGEAIIGAASGGAAMAFKGAIESGVMSDVSGAVESRIARMGVGTSTEEAAPAAANALAPSEEDAAAVSSGIKYGVAGSLGGGTYWTGVPGDHN